MASRTAAGRLTYWDDRMGQVMEEATSRPFAMVLGRKTYDIMAAYWPTAPQEEGGQVFNDATKYVASRSKPDAGLEQFGVDRG